MCCRSRDFFEFYRRYWGTSTSGRAELVEGSAWTHNIREKKVSGRGARMVCVPKIGTLKGVLKYFTFGFFKGKIIARGAPSGKGREHPSRRASHPNGSFGCGSEVDDPKDVHQRCIPLPVPSISFSSSSKSVRV